MKIALINNLYFPYNKGGAEKIVEKQIQKLKNSGHEAFGLVLIEALACGLPVIASDLPGVRGVFEDKKQGLLIKRNNILDLQEKINYLLEDEETRQDMSIEARKLAVKKYDQNLIADKILDEFSNL